MSSDENYYAVKTNVFAERHYIKVFKKKYKRAWDVTRKAIENEARRIDNVIVETDKAETIRAQNGNKLIKLYFKVAQTQQSALSSGNRAILFVNEERREAEFLLVYSKNQIGSPNETQKWQRVIREQYPEVWHLFDQG